MGYFKIIARLDTCSIFHKPNEPKIVPWFVGSQRKPGKDSCIWFTESDDIQKAIDMAIEKRLVYCDNVGRLRFTQEAAQKLF